ncbi:hypothetical protein CHELA1G11_13737 [Hyphomicrobiales bacterium]|nr:hypothetical protein CHELA1G2_10578 [Hyphomicrobiales bacterium]CAH1673686.1 hypothetical protein CHELA1G11_13737 [Hyphomicrobiales bacterium]
MHEVLEDRDPAHQVRDGFEQRPAGIEAGLGDAAGTQQIGGGESGARRQEAEAGETVENDLRQVVPIGNQIGKRPDEDGLLDQARDDVVIRAPRPEQRGQRDVDHDQGGGQEGDFAAEQAEAGVDIAGEYAEEAINNACAAHGSPPFAGCVRLRRWRTAKESIARFGPHAQAVGIIGSGFAQLLATALFKAKRVGRRLKRRSGRRWLDVFLAGHFDDRRRDGHGDEYNGRKPGQHLAIHDVPLFRPVSD